MEYNELVWSIVEQVLSESEILNQKAIRRNAEKLIKHHNFNAKQYERQSIQAEEQGKERKSEALYDKANGEWDKATQQEERADNAKRKVDELIHNN